MTIKESMLKVWNKVRQGPMTVDGREANLLNGGHTGYHPPVQAKQQKKPQQAPQTGYDPNFYQNTGFQQVYQYGAPAQQGGWQQTGYQQTGWQQAGTGYAPNMAHQSAGSWQQPVQNGWQQAQPTGYAGGAQQNTGFAGAQQPQQQPGFAGQNTGFAGAQQSQQQTGFMQGRQATGYAGGVQQNTGFAGAQQPQQQTGFMKGRQAQQNEQSSHGPYQTEGNVTYAFGQQFKDQNGVAYSHVERLAQPLSVATCFRLIEFMRAGESIIVNLELVTDENERSRCIDMLYGAAFTMQCSFTRVASRCLYLIAPNNVQVLAYESIRQLSEQDAESRWPQEAGSGVRTDVRWSDRSRRQASGFGGDERRYGFSR